MNKFVSSFVIWPITASRALYCSSFALFTKDLHSRFNDFALIIIKDQKSLKQKIFEETKNNNILRYYGIGAQIIKDLNIKNKILVSRSKKKIIGLDGFGIKIIKQEIIK